MTLPAYEVHAFAGTGFAGNPAMVCPLERWLDDATLQRIARENAFPVTAFFLEGGEPHELRWFTPTVELNLCGHGTLASAAVIFQRSGYSRESVTFETRGGIFKLVKEGPLIALAFPVHAALPCPDRPEALVRALGREPREILRAQNHLAVYESEAEIRAIDPDMELLKTIDGLGVIVTAPAESADFVSRYFVPKIGLPEDAATGSSHCTLAPYWSARLGQRKLHALQLSRRGGELWCECCEDRVRISARALIRSEGIVTL